MFSPCALARLTACVLIALCGAFLTIPCAWFSYESFTHNQPVTGMIFGVTAIVGLMGMYGAGVWFYSIAYDRGQKDYFLKLMSIRTEELWRGLDKKSPTAASECLFCNGTRSIFLPEENHYEPCVCVMEEATPSDVPLVKLGQGDYERNYPESPEDPSSDPETGTVEGTVEWHIARGKLD